LAQKTYDTHESSEKAALKELLSSLDLDGVLIQAEALHTTQAFSLVPGAGGRPAVDPQIEPVDPLPASRLPIRGKALDPFHCNACGEVART
jgi:hypothetical protein